mgnify:CR=1 FL=1
MTVPVRSVVVVLTYVLITSVSPCGVLILLARHQEVGLANDQSEPLRRAMRMVCCSLLTCISLPVDNSIPSNLSFSQEVTSRNRR